MRVALKQDDQALAAPVRYLKLGPGNRWADRAFSQGELPLGHREVPHELALGGDASAIAAHLVSQGRSPAKARDFAREVMDFYRLGPETIWITFAGGRLWWARAEAEVAWLGDGDDHGARVRKVIGGWRDTDLAGRPLVTSQLSTRLTKVGAYRQTLCAVEASDYLLRRLAGESAPHVEHALAALREAQAGVEALIGDLHWSDFETLVELLLARGGWHRISPLGGLQKDIDMIVEQPVTGELAFVQVKSAATQAVLDDYLARFDAQPHFSRLIFACHSAKGRLDTGGREDVILWARESLARTAVRSGLTDWLIARVG